MNGSENVSQRKKDASAAPPVRARRRSRRGFILLLVLLLLGIAAYLLFHHRFFRVKYVKIEGNRNLSIETIVDTLGDVNQNIFLLSRGGLEKKLLAIPGVRKAQVTKEYPNRLRIGMEEEFSLGQLEPGGRWIDQEGRIRDDSVDVTNVEKAPLIVGLPVTAAVGEYLSEDVRITQFLGLLMQSKLIGKIEKISFEKIDNIDIIYGDVNVQFGSLNDLIKKISTLEAVIQDVEEKKIHATEILLNRGKNPIVVTESGK